MLPLLLRNQSIASIQQARYQVNRSNPHYALQALLVKKDKYLRVQAKCHEILAHEYRRWDKYMSYIVIAMMSFSALLGSVAGNSNNDTSNSAESNKPNRAWTIISVITAFFKGIQSKLNLQDKARLHEVCYKQCADISENIEIVLIRGGHTRAQLLHYITMFEDRINIQRREAAPIPYKLKKQVHDQINNINRPFVEGEIMLQRSNSESLIQVADTSSEPVQLVERSRSRERSRSHPRSRVQSRSRPRSRPRVATHSRQASRSRPRSRQPSHDMRHLAEVVIQMESPMPQTPSSTPKTGTEWHADE
jgi:hypothetical protein